jgi:aspartate/methionine/tyrosine aminotransferase
MRVCDLQQVYLLVNFTLTGYKGMLSAFMGFIEPGDEVIIFEPFFDQYVELET